MALDLTSGETLLQTLSAQYGAAQGARLYARITTDNPKLDAAARGPRGTQGLFALTEKRWRETLEGIKESPLNVYGYSPAGMIENFRTLSKDPDVAGWVADRIMDEDHRKVLGWVNETNAARGVAPVSRLTDAPGWTLTETDAALLAVGAQTSESQPLRALVGANGEMDMGGMIKAFEQSTIGSTVVGEGSAQGATDFTRPITAAIAGNQLLFKIGGDSRQLMGLDPDEIASVRRMTPPSATVTPRDHAINQMDLLQQERRRTEVEDELQGINQRLDASVFMRGDPALDATIEPVVPEDIARLGSLTEELAGVNQNMANLRTLQDAHTQQTTQALRESGRADSVGNVYGEPLAGESPVERTLTQRIGEYLSSAGPEGSMADGLFGEGTWGRDVMEYLNLPVPPARDPAVSILDETAQPGQTPAPSIEEALAQAGTTGPTRDDSNLDFAPSQPLAPLLSGDPVANFDELRPGSLGRDARGGPGRGSPTRGSGEPDLLQRTSLENFTNSLRNQSLEDRASAIQDIRVVDNRRNALAALGAGTLPSSAQFQDFAFSQPAIDVQSQADFNTLQIDRAVDPLGRAFSDNARDLRDAVQFNELIAPVAGGLNQGDPAYQRQVQFVMNRLQGRE